jgi:hypothetical protein
MTHKFNSTLRQVYTRDVGMAFLKYDAIWTEKIISPQFATISSSDKYLMFSDLLYDNGLTLIIDICFYETFSTTNL